MGSGCPGRVCPLWPVVATQRLDRGICVLQAEGGLLTCAGLLWVLDIILWAVAGGAYRWGQAQQWSQPGVRQPRSWELSENPCLQRTVSHAMPCARLHCPRELLASRSPGGGTERLWGDVHVCYPEQRAGWRLLAQENQSHPRSLWTPRTKLLRGSQGGAGVEQVEEAGSATCAGPGPPSGAVGAWTESTSGVRGRSSGGGRRKDSGDQASPNQGLLSKLLLGASCPGEAALCPPGASAVEQRADVI